MTDEKSTPDNAQPPVLHFHYAGLTDTGRVRKRNEDAYKLPSSTDPKTLATKGHLYVLADGMGGHQKGEVASAVTIETVNAEYYTSVIDLPASNPEHAIIAALTSAIEKANLHVMDATQGGGTTVVAAVLYDDSLVAMNVGDSRAYLLRNNTLQLISRDHSLVSRLVEMGKLSEKEALSHPKRNVLYQALGQGNDVEIYIVREKLQLDDVIILCSDGLWGEVDHEAMKDVLSSNKNPRAAIETLIRLANETGGLDNITAIVIHVASEAPPEAGYGSQVQSPASSRQNPDDTHPSLPVIQPRFKRPTSLPENELQAD